MRGALTEYLPRCTFATPGTDVACALSGGADSSALVALAVAAGCNVTAHHVDHGLRPTSGDEARQAAAIAAQLGVECVVHRVSLDGDHNLEARARAARLAVLPAAHLTGHTADDQAETVLLRLIRGAGLTGLRAIEPGPRRPLLALRRSDTEAVCEIAGITPLADPTNDSPQFWRNRVRHELLPLIADITDRDPVPILARTAELVADDDAFVDEAAARLDPTDAKALAAAPRVLAKRALRAWLTRDGYPPSAAGIDRAYAVACGSAVACELEGGWRVERSQQRLRLVAPGAVG